MSPNKITDYTKAMLDLEMGYETSKDISDAKERAINILYELKITGIDARLEEKLLGRLLYTVGKFEGSEEANKLEKSLTQH